MALDDVPEIWDLDYAEPRTVVELDELHLARRRAARRARCGIDVWAAAAAEYQQRGGVAPRRRVSTGLPPRTVRPAEPHAGA